MRTFVFRRERATQIKAERGGLVVELTKRRWRVRPGDRLLLSTGTGRELKFDALATIRDVHEEPIEEVGLHRYSMAIEEWHDLEPRLFDEMVYSLEKIANMARPHLHMRHHSVLTEADTETIRSGEVDAARSMYFGVLQDLERKTRAEVDAYLQFLSKRTDRQFEASKVLPFLVDWIERNALLAVELGQHIADLRAKLHWHVPLVGTLSAEGMGGTRREWDVTDLLNYAAEHGADTRERISHFATTMRDIVPGDNKKWRPHHW
jgi:hypothetical protein